MRKPRWFARMAAVLVLAALSGSGATMAAAQKPKEWKPEIDPANFVSAVTNEYFPLQPGKKYRYQQKGGDEALVVEILNQTKTILGVQTRVVRETHTQAGQVVEISENWFAQDRDGNVWYFGEATQNIVNGSPANSNGSWEAGKAGAMPGIIMKGHPERGETYFQEYSPGVAEDMASVLSNDGTETVPAGTYTNVLRTKEWTPLEGSSLEHKYYARGVGLILEEEKGARLELVAIE